MKQNNVIGVSIFSILLLMIVFWMPLSVKADDVVPEELKAGEEKEFAYPASDFNLEYVFIPEEDGVYDIRMALPSGEYDIDCAMVTEYHTQSTSRNSVINKDDVTGYCNIFQEPMLTGTEYRIQFNIKAVVGKSGVGKILINKNDEIVLKDLNFNSTENMICDGYYYFTAPKDGKYQVEIITNDDSSEDEWGRVSAYFGKTGEYADMMFYQNQTVYTRGFELLEGESSIIHLYYNAYGTNFTGTIKVTEFFDNQLQAYVSGTQETEKIVYIPEGETATLSVDAWANDTSNISYEWVKYNEDSYPERIDVTGNTCEIEDSPWQIYCLVKDQYGNEKHVSFSIVGLSGNLEKNIPAQIQLGYNCNTVLYKFTAEESDYYTIYTSSPEDAIYADMLFYDSENLENEIFISDYEWNYSFKGDIYLKEGQSIFILVDGHSQGEMQLCIRSSKEMGYVVIDENTFPDDVFRECIKDEYDWGENGLLSPEEIENVQSLYIQGSDLKSKISSLEGIEIFNNLEILNCRENTLEELDISKNTALKYLDCENNQLASLDVSKNINLETLWCSDNQLTDLDISKNTKLNEVSCYNHQRTVMVTDSNTFDLSTLSNTFEKNKVCNWTGGIVKDNILTFTNKSVTYSYDIGNNQKGYFTLVASNYTEDEGDVDDGEGEKPPVTDTEKPDEEKPGISSPAEEKPKPSVPQVSVPSEPAVKEPFASGEVITDAKKTNVYQISGKVSSGYIVTYVRPSSKNVKSITIPSTVTVKGVNCKVTAIADNALKGQKKLKKITIGSNVITIGKKAFFGCKNLKKIVIKSKGLKKIGAKAFAKISQDAKIKLPKNKKKAYSKLLKKNTGINKKML